MGVTFHFMLMFRAQCFVGHCCNGNIIFRIPLYKQSFVLYIYWRVAWVELTKKTSLYELNKKLGGGGLPSASKIILKCNAMNWTQPRWKAVGPISDSLSPVWKLYSNAMSLVVLHCQALTSIEPALFERSKRGVNK